MKPTDKDTFIKSISTGDIGLIHAHNLFATMQNLYRLRFKEGPLEASHGFYVRLPPEIAEADGLFVSNATYLKDIGDKTEAWFFRYPKLTGEQWADMEDYVDGMIDAGGHYSVGGIAQFALQFCGVRKKISDEGGVFCTELTGKVILKAGLPYITDVPPYAVTPSHQLNWFSTVGTTLGWILAAYYDGKGNYFLAEKQEAANGPTTANPNPA